MLCPNCGKQNPDGGRFCSYCGYNLIKSSLEEENAVHSGEACSGTEPALETSVPKDDISVEKPVEEASSERPEGIRRPNTMVLGVIAATFFSALMILVVIFAGAPRSEYMVMYVSGEKYGLISDVENASTVELDACRSDKVSEKLIRFSEGGNYIYFLTRYDGSFGTLNRIASSSARNIMGRNDEDTETIANDVRDDFAVYGNTGLIFRNSSGTLFYYNGEETVQLAKSVRAFRADSGGRLIYASGEDGTYALFGIMLDDPNNRQKLVAESTPDCFDVECGQRDFDKILYICEENGERNLYSAGFDREPLLLAKNVTALTPTGAPGEQFYFSAATDEKFDYYSCMRDIRADADATLLMKAPERVYVYEMVTQENLASAGEELYTSCTLPVAKLEGKSIKDAETISFGIRTAIVRATLTQFNAKYIDKQDADGYIAITEEIKTDLKTISIGLGGDGVDDWKLLCYKKKSELAYPEGVTEQSYNSALKRNEKREQLKRQISVSDIFYWDGREQLKIAENAVAASAADGGCLVWSKDDVSRYLKDFDVDTADVIVSLSGCKALLEIPEGSTSSTETVIPEGTFSAKTGIIDPGKAVTVSGGTVFITYQDGSLMKAEISPEKKLGSPEELAQDAATVKENDGVLYYISDAYQRTGSTYADLYRYESGENICIAKEILVDDVTLRFYQDGKTLAYTGTSATGGYELTLFEQDGSSRYIADGVTACRRLDQATVVYISEGDLYAYSGNTRNMLKNGVEAIWVYGAMESLSEIKISAAD